MRTFDERRNSVEAYTGKIKRTRRRNVALATSICLAVAILAAVLFVPYSTTPPDVSMYAGSDYYNLIQRLNEATYQKPRYKNNFEALVDNLDFGLRKGGLMMDGAMPMAPGNAPNYELSGGETSDNYEEVTDNQVEGVIEADLLKRSDKYAFYLRGGVLSVYTIAGEESKIVGTHKVAGYVQTDFVSNRDELSYLSGTEMYLSMDCKTVTVILRGYGKSIGDFTALVNLDVSDPANITEKGRVYFSGDYVSSRMVDGQVLLTYNYRVLKAQIDFDDPATFVPQYGTPENMNCIPNDNIICPDNVSDSRYTVVCKVDAESLAVMGTTALLSYSQELYVSEDTIYATHSYTEKNQEKFDNNYQQKTMTEITGISYAGESLEILGTIALEGNVKDQYSMDQFEGVLRVVTSTTVSYFTETFYGEFASSARSETKRNVNLYCIDLENWEVAASVIGFAPEGEDAQSVRFDGYNAYVCTAEVITVTDPVYFFDLSDLENITWKDTGTIDGYSTSLIQLGDGYLLGIGFNAGRSLKIEVYEETENGVVSVCTYERDASFPDAYKAYLVDRENDLIGLHVRDYTADRESVYILLHFDGYKLQPIVSQLTAGYQNYTRAFIAYGYLYVFSSDSINNFSVTKIA